MFKKIRRWFIEQWHYLNQWVDDIDICEVCGNESADDICVNCKKRICMMCNSGYYIDAELCTKCCDKMTPEEKEEDRRETLAREDKDA